MERDYTVQCSWGDFKQMLLSQFSHLKKKLFVSSNKINEKISCIQKPHSKQVEVVYELSESMKTQLGKREIRISYTLDQDQIVSLVKESKLKEKIESEIMTRLKPACVAVHSNVATMSEEEEFIKCVFV